MLAVKNLHVAINGKEIINGLDLDVKAGQVHAIMGPNGSGKSTLAQALAGREGYEVTQGSVRYLKHDLLAMTAEQRARAGLFLAFQYPVEIPGVSIALFLRTGLNAIRREQGLPELDAMDFLGLVRARMRELDMDESFLSRAVNEGFSGGEKKRNEILQMLILEPKLLILDEPDSGLDIDALRFVADSINKMRNPQRSIVLVTHYQRLLDYIVPDVVHVLSQGRIVKSGGPELAHELEKHGYGRVEAEAVAKKPEKQASRHKSGQMA